MNSQTRINLSFGALVCGLVTVLIYGPLAPRVSANPQLTMTATAIPRMVPFMVEIPGGLANSAGAGSANPKILIDSDGQAGHFVTSSIVVRTNAPSSGFQTLSVNYARLNSEFYHFVTASILGPAGGGVQESADIMGTPVDAVDFGTAVHGGSFPRELIVQNAGSIDDIIIQLFARSDTSDMDIEKVRVTGWKRAGDNISVVYVPGV